MKLSPHFSLAELTTTGHRSLAEQNWREAQEIAPLHALTMLCQTLLEPLRAHFDAPVIIHSGYRCLPLNEAVGGAKASQHLRGEAADLHVVGHELEAVWTWVWRDSGLPYGQALLEGHVAGVPRWLHLSLGEPFRPLARSRQHFRIEDA